MSKSEVIEKYILGCCMVDNDYIGKALEIININDFDDILHREIFKGLVSCYNQNMETNDIFVKVALRNNEICKSRGGDKYIDEIMGLESTFAFDTNLKLLKEQSNIRKLNKLVLNLQEDIKKGDKSSKDLLDKASQDIYELSINGQNEKKGLVDSRKSAIDLLKKIEKIKNTKNYHPNIMTGFKQLDQITTGFGKQNLIVIAGKTSSGKSSFTMNIVENIAKQGKSVAVFSMEMSTEELNIRLASSLSQIDNYKITFAKMNECEEMTLQNSILELSKLPIYIDDSSSVDFIYIRNQLRKLGKTLAKANKTLDMVVIDHLQIMKRNSELKSIYAQITELSREAKNLAKDFNVPVILLCQMNKDSEKRENNEPRLNDLRDSGSISENADKVLFVHRLDYFNHDDPDLRNRAKILVRKNRGGQMSGDVEMLFEPSLTKFREVEI